MAGMAARSVRVWVTNPTNLCGTRHPDTSLAPPRRIDIMLRFQADMLEPAQKLSYTRACPYPMALVPMADGSISCSSGER